MSAARSSEADIQRVLGAGGANSVSGGRMVLHSLPIGYSLDANRGIADPIGMLGETLGVDMHVVTADEAPLGNLELAINRCHLEVETVVATPYASGLAALVDDEAELGVALIDMGGGTTTLSIFHGGEFVHADAIAVGGQHVTLDIARGLSTNLADAERIKARHGSALPSNSDERDILTIPPVGEDERDHPNTVPRGALTRIIRPRVEEILEMTRDMLTSSGFAGEIGKRIVLTGGASQLTGLAETAGRILGAQCAHRTPARRRRVCRRRRRARHSRRRRADHLPAGGADRAVPRPRAVARGDDGNRRISRPHGAVDQGQLLTKRRTERFRRRGRPGGKAERTER